MKLPGDVPNVIILGMLRSGTSMTTGIFARKGFYTTGRLLTPDESNPKGYFEPLELIELNAQLLHQAGHPHHNTWRYEPVSPEAESALAVLEPDENCAAFLAKCEANSPFVWKDIRLCYTFPVWSKLLNLDHTRCILLRRDPEAIYRSMVRRHWAQPHHTLESVIKLRELHLDHAVRSLEAAGATWMEVQFEDYFADLEGVACKLSEFIGIPFRPEEVQVTRELNHDSIRDRGLDSMRRALSRPGLRGAKKVMKKVLPRTWREWAFPEQRLLRHERKERG